MLKTFNRPPTINTYMKYGILVENGKNYESWCKCMFVESGNIPKDDVKVWVETELVADTILKVEAFNGAWQSYIRYYDFVPM
jgi:hypothetical protein